jgi:peptidoglycan hydrolase-like protein with peptidoglycan-binding domain
MADEPDLSPGDTGEHVTYAKQLLNYLDSSAQVDEGNDRFDDAFSAALRRFQAARGLPETGSCDRATWAALLYREGESGDGVSGDGEVLAEPVWMEIETDYYAERGLIRWWAGNPAQRARTDAQTIKVDILKPDGSDSWGSQGAFPTTNETIDPGAYAIIDTDTVGVWPLMPGQGYTLRVTVNPGTQVENSRDYKFDVNDQFEWNHDPNA